MKAFILLGWKTQPSHKKPKRAKKKKQVALLMEGEDSCSVAINI